MFLFWFSVGSSEISFFFHLQAPLRAYSNETIRKWFEMMHKPRWEIIDITLDDEKYQRIRDLQIHKEFYAELF